MTTPGSPSSTMRWLCDRCQAWFDAEREARPVVCPWHGGPTPAQPVENEHDGGAS